MFLFKNKLDDSLRYSLESKLYKTYRINIHCKTLFENVEKKVKSLKGTVLRVIPTVNLICASVSGSAIERLIEYPEIDYISTDSMAFLCGSSVLAANGVSLKGKYQLSGKGVGIALVDSGVFPHLDLQKPNNKIYKFIDVVNNAKYPYDDYGHGTFMAGIICGSGYSSKGMYRGIAENSHMYVIKVFNGLGRAYISDILYSLEAILQDAEEFNIRVACLPFELMEHNFRVVNYFNIFFEKFISYGIIPIVPAGSQGNEEGSIRGIAVLKNCITVGGIDTTGYPKPYKYSSSGPFCKLEKPDLSAACVDICSINTNVKYISERNGIKLFPQALEKPYTTYTGTSCSAAYISGVCALLLENNNDLAFKDIISLLKVSCSTLDTSRWLQGSGTVNLEKLMP